MSDLKARWQAMPIEQIVVEPAALEQRTSAFSRLISRRNLQELVAGLIGAIAFSGVAMKESGLVSLGAWLSVVGVLVAVGFVFAGGRVDQPSPAEPLVIFHQRMLRRQITLLRRVWLGYLLPMVPGLGCFIVGLSLQMHDATSRSVVIGVGVLVMAVFATVGWLNRREANRLEAELVALETSLR
ncbi:MAG: hypothetical protein GQE15_01275 [Archangiaceae bacterium]|nr:hypothetical protein [Archangiaceae bacterium]